MIEICIFINIGLAMQRHIHRDSRMCHSTILPEASFAP